MYWTLELASKLEDAPWPATKDELIDYAMRSGAPLEVIENLQEMEDEGQIYESIEDIWPDYPIDDHTRQYSYYTYKLIKVSEGSKEQKILNEVKAMKEKILSIPVDRKGKYVAILHYALMDKLNNL